MALHDILLTQDDQLDLIACLLDDSNGVIHVPWRLTVDGQDLVIFSHPVSGSLAPGDYSGNEDPGVFFVVLVEASVNEGEAEAS